ncbi:efflux RND transporter periplasmic adaptor subunit [Herminiimonas arsenitoxidans]|uniref:efflux RND transporter periplasmic adaptor subunit n=1 Tax=Herminiimonas arsenitoxidans TaxID=1809410 RepID=UPI0009709086|nr:efflux RND transporter periplasmic adaptor subunit [Herminiimonas arsenitoxidans]
MKINPRNKQTTVIIIVVVIGLLLGGLILGMDRKGASSEEQGHGHAEAKGHADMEHHGEKSTEKHDDAGEHEDDEHHADSVSQKGPQGGKLFTKDGYGLEITIFENEGEPQFRVYTYQNDKPLDPAATKLVVTLERLGRAPQNISFSKENGYLKGNAVIEEPHSFKVQIKATSGDKPYEFSYVQEEAQVAMSDTQLAQNGVKILKAGSVRIKTELQLIGEIRLNEDRTVHVVPRLAGIVESVRANAGDQVRKGQILAVISSQALSDQRSELLAAQKRLALARTTYEREKTLWEEKISAEQDYLQARTTMQEAQIIAQSAQQKLAALGASPSASNLTQYEIRSPIDGVITEKRISAGTVAKEDANIFDISDLSTVWVDLTVRAQDINALKTGQKATVKATAFDAEGSGTVSYIGSLVGEQTRAAKARVVLANPKGTWRPGLAVNVALVSDEVDVPVAVTTDSIQTVGDRTVVFVRYGNVLEARPLQLSRRDGKFIEVLKGLKAGEDYAATNSFLIKAELGKASASHDH